MALGSDTTSPDELRKAAERYRQIAGLISDERAIEALYELAAEYEAQAAAVEAASEAVELGKRKTGGR